MKPLLPILILILILMVVVTGCTARSAYDTLRVGQEMNCQKLLGSDREECLRRSEVSYDEYQRQLKKSEEYK